MGVALVAIVLISLPDGTVGRTAGPAFHGAKPVDWLLVLGAGLGAAGFFLFTDHAHQVGLGTAGTLMAIRLTSLSWMLLVVLVVWLRSLRSPRRAGVRVPRVAVGLGLVASVGDLTGTVAYLLRDVDRDAVGDRGAGVAVPGQHRAAGARVPPRAAVPRPASWAWGWPWRVPP